MTRSTLDFGRHARGRAHTRLALCSLAHLALAVASSTPAAAQQGRAFTVGDALDVRSVNVADVTDDGRWVAATVQTRRDRLGVDHARFGDPTYVAPSPVRVLVVDTRDGARFWVHEEPVQAGGLAWSPAGDRLAYRWYDGSESHVRIWDRATRTARTVPARTDKRLAWSAPLLWSPGGETLLVGLRPVGWAEEARRAFLELTEGPVIVQDSRDDFLDWDRVRNLDDRTIPALMDVDDGSVRELMGEANLQAVRFSDDGAWLAATRVIELETAYERDEGSTYQLLRIPTAGGDPEPVTEASGRRLAAHWSPAADAIVYGERGSVFLRRAGADTAVDLTAAHRRARSADDTARVSYAVERWSPDGSRVLVTSGDAWHVLDPSTTELETIFQLEDDEEARPRRNVQAWSEDGRWVYFSTSARDRWARGLQRLDVGTGEVETLLLDDGVYGDWAVSRDGSTVVYARSDGNRPEELWALSSGAAEPIRLTDSNPQLEGVALSRTELVEYLDVDGETQYGILYYPLGWEPGRRYPLVAEIYEDFFDNGYNENMNLITAQGWFGFRPSVRFEEGYPGEAWLKGVTAGINEVIDRGLVDGDRLGVHGTSYGGYATNLLITQTDRFAAAINISGKVNIISFLGDSPKITTRNYRAAEIGQDRIGATLWEQPHKYVAHSAVMFADRIDTPLLMLSGEGDWNVPATNQREMYYALRRLGKKVVWVHYMNAGHGAGRAGTEADFRDHWSRIVGWYAEHFAEAERKTATDGGR